MALEGNLGDRLTITLDPSWPHIGLWQHPFGRTLRVTFVDFESGIQEGADPNYVPSEVVGRAEAYMAYINTRNRRITIPFKFRAQGVAAGTQRAAIDAEVINPVRFLDALKYPVHDPNLNLSFAPPTVIVHIGELLTARCILTGGDINWIHTPMETDTLLPHGADFTAQFEVVRTFQADLSYFPAGESGGPISGDWL